MLSEREFKSYLYASLELKTIEERYKQERADAYDAISPTMTLPDYSLGRITAGTVTVEDHAIYLYEIYHDYEKDKARCLKRIDLLEQAVSLLYEDERAEFEEWKANPLFDSALVLQTLNLCLEHLLGSDEKEEINVEEWDKMVDEMDDEELFSTYWDRNGDFDKEIVRRRQIYRLTVHNRGIKSKAEINAEINKNAS